MFSLNAHRIRVINMAIAPLLEKPQKNRAWRRRRLHAPRKKTPITGAEAKVYATLKSDAIRVILECTDSHAD